MARGTTLGALVVQLRAEIGHSTDPAVGQEKLDQLKQVLKRNQEILYDDYDWPFLRIRDADKTLSIGQRFYDFPATVNPDRVSEVMVYWGSIWVPVIFGITDSDYNNINSAVGDTSDPVQKWDWYADGSTLQFETWPMPATAGTMRFHGIRPLPPLVADADTAALDDRLIVLYSAAELRQGQKDGQAKSQLAQKRLRDLRAQGVKSAPVRIGGGYSDMQRRKPVTIRISGA